MAKQGLDIKTIYPVLKDANSKTGWSICIGAGTSRPLLPDWYSLVEKLINNNCDKDNIISIDKYKQLGFTPDTMIQAVKNHLKTDDDIFLKILSEELFLPIKDKLSNDEWKTFIKIHETNNISGITKNEWALFSQVVEKCFKQTTANHIADVIVDSIQNEIAPKSIISFNGEAILLSLLNYYFYIRTNSKKLQFDRVVNSISVRDSSRIPYIHCHGIIPINGVTIRKGKKAGDKLVFSEDSYLQLSNNAFSWQANSFINSCLNSKMVFIGVSLTDSNMRRWLSWIHANKVKELAINNIEYPDATEHFWICVKPKTKQEMLWIEESVSHLGVRLVWINNWNQVGTVLRRMLDIEK